MKAAGLREQIIAVADPLIDSGHSLAEVNRALFERLGITIGGGGGGGDGGGGKRCRYCGASGRGGHGGFCPNGGGW